MESITHPPRRLSPHLASGCIRSTPSPGRPNHGGSGRENRETQDAFVTVTVGIDVAVGVAVTVTVTVTSWTINGATTMTLLPGKVAPVVGQPRRKWTVAVAVLQLCQLLE